MQFTTKSNYRPISLLPIMSEKRSMRDNALLYDFQSGFRRSFSTETAKIRLDRLQKWSDNNKMTLSETKTKAGNVNGREKNE